MLNDKLWTMGSNVLNIPNTSQKGGEECLNKKRDGGYNVMTRVPGAVPQSLFLL
jgi:hypothetical protein